MPTFDFEGRAIPYEPGDTVASALYRADVRTFSRSFKFHRPRGLYCLTGDCPNCLCRVDGAGEVPACTTPAERVRAVEREGGWPSPERDAMAVNWRLRKLLPVGFYYKWVVGVQTWKRIEPMVRRAAGRSAIPASDGVELPIRRHVHPELLVIGAGPAGLAAALAAAEDGVRVLLVDESRPGFEVAPGPTADAIAELLPQVEAHERVELLTDSAALAVHEGPLVPIRREGELLVAEPRRVIVATGAVESHQLFAGNDLPGIWLARGAARMTGRHRLSIGTRVVVAGSTSEALEHVRTLEAGGARVERLLLDADAAAGVQHPALRVGGRIVAAHGRRTLRAVTIEQGGRTERIACDALVLASARVPRDGLLRQAHDVPGVSGAGEAVDPGCELAAALASGRAAVRAEAAAPAAIPAPRTCARAAGSGVACLCEDVLQEDLEQAWKEGYRSTEIIKRYSTVTMGPCQGAMCHHHLKAFVAERSDAPAAAGPTSARPPARPVRMSELAAGVRHPIEERTALHELHVAAGARWEWAGHWRRPSNYGDVEREYRAVRERVGVMDVGTLGKVRVSGRDAVELLERIYPCNIGNIAPGRMRYGLVLSEAGHVIDDGVICALEDGAFYLTFTTTGAGGAEAWLRRWAAEWNLRVNIVNQTRALGGINLAGPRARDVLEALSTDELSNESFPYLHHREITVAGVPTRAIRLGFVGELAYELHHPASQSRRLWEALFEAGRRYDAAPHGLDVVNALRLEKGHIIVGQDTDFDTTPAAAGIGWAVRGEKPFFLGKAELERRAGDPPQRVLRGIRWPGGAPPEGAVVTAAGAFAGAVTSSWDSGALGHGVSLALLQCGTDGEPPATVAYGDAVGTVGDGVFYDPEGVKVRA